MAQQSIKAIHKHFKLAKELESDDIFIDVDPSFDDKLAEHNIKLNEYNENKQKGIKTKYSPKPTFKHLALIIGNKGTPYEGGFFMFELNYINEYPLYPPRVTFLNVTVFNRGRLHPNLYQVSLNGKVCLSLIGTWGQNTWDSQTSSIGEILLAIKAIVLVDDPLQTGEPPYKHGLSLRENYSYSVQVLVYLDYILGTLSKMKDDSFQNEYIEPFKDIILAYFDRNKDMYIELFNNLYINTRLRILNLNVNEEGAFMQSFYQIPLVCNLERLEKTYKTVIEPGPNNISDLLSNADFSSIKQHKCMYILTTGKNKGCQCSLNKKTDYFCNKHSSVYPSTIAIADIPLIKNTIGIVDAVVDAVVTDAVDAVDAAVEKPVIINITKCGALILSGVNKGTQCKCNPLATSHFCGRHKKLQTELISSYGDISFEEQFKKTPAGQLSN